MVHFSPMARGSNRYLVSTGLDGCVCFWTWNTAKMTFDPKPLKFVERSRAGAGMRCCSFSPGGNVSTLTSYHYFMFGSDSPSLGRLHAVISHYYFFHRYHLPLLFTSIIRLYPLSHSPTRQVFSWRRETRTAWSAFIACRSPCPRRFASSKRTQTASTAFSIRIGVTASSPGQRTALPGFGTSGPRNGRWAEPRKMEQIVCGHVCT